MANGELETIKISMPEYKVILDNDKETRILELTKYSDMANAYMRELQMRKDDAFLTTWFNALHEKSLLRIYNLLKTVMQERGINAKG